MKFTKIVGFGDSWVYGDELVSPHLPFPYNHPANQSYRESKCFLGQLGTHYQVPAINFGMSGASLQSTIWKFLEWYQKDANPAEALILIGLTESDRFSYYTPDGMFHNTWVDADDAIMPREFKQLIKQQTVLATSPKLGILNYQQAVHLFDGMTARHNLILVQYNIAPPPTDLLVPTLMDPNGSLTSWFVQGLQQVHGRKYIKENGHPNEIGHELITQRLISYIDSCTM